MLISENIVSNLYHVRNKRWKKPIWRMDINWRVESRILRSGFEGSKFENHRDSVVSKWRRLVLCYCFKLLCLWCLDAYQNSSLIYSDGGAWYFLKKYIFTIFNSWIWRQTPTEMCSLFLQPKKHSNLQKECH